MCSGMQSSLCLWILLLLLSVIPSPIISDHAINGCPQKCGTIEVPYPFGISDGCFLPSFEVSCNNVGETPVPFLAGTGFQILTISNGNLKINSTEFIATDCAHRRRTLANISLPEGGPFTISESSNIFMAIGCDTVAVITDDNSIASGCVSLCTTRGSVASGSCSGAGCCESTVPRGTRYVGLGASSMFGYRNVSGFSNCSYAFVVERGSFTFMESDLQGFGATADIGMVLEWGIGDGNCSQIASQICGKNSFFVESYRGFGCLCNCSDGFAGNPYRNDSDGCKDVDECLNLESSPCVSDARCSNKVPGYVCKCPFGSSGDGTKLGSGCRKFFQILEVVLGTALGFVIMLLCSTWCYYVLKKRTLIKLKEQYFRQNGGLLLKQQVSNREGGGGECPRIFSSAELKQVTQNYDDTRILGAGGYGTVYKGTLEDGTDVAIKKSKVMDQNQIDQFINEVVILTQINHRNVVKLLGCCLETEVPMLVYEFIPNGTLHKHIHESNPTPPISWVLRLRIAIETAEALAYLHSATSMPIFHRDVKSSNILLDENYTAKVADFGISRLVPMDQSQIPTLVQGTLGYLDPEYFQTSQLTEKSDVYSFGVVLVELLTGQKPVSFERSQENSNLAMYFLSCLRSKDLGKFIEESVLREGGVEQVRAVAELGRKCLLLRGDKRPTMKEVARELVRIGGFGREKGVESEEAECGDDLANERCYGMVDAQDVSHSHLTLSYDLAR